MRAWKNSTREAPGRWTAPSSQRLQPASGSRISEISLSAGQPASGKPSSRARLQERLAKRVSRQGTTDCPGSSPSYPSPERKERLEPSSPRWHESICSFWTTGYSLRSNQLNEGTSPNSWMIATTNGPSSSAPNCLSINGTPSSVILRSPMQSSTDSSITRTSSQWTENPCANPKASAPKAAVSSTRQKDSKPKPQRPPKRGGRIPSETVAG